MGRVTGRLNFDPFYKMGGSLEGDWHPELVARTSPFVCAALKTQMKNYQVHEQQISSRLHHFFFQ